MIIRFTSSVGLMAFSCVSFAGYPAIVGDIIARDLVGVPWVGHIGVLSADTVYLKPTIVLEAMNTVPHIQINSIADFKSRSAYWGSKGGLLSPGSWDAFFVANSIVRQYYACPEYSYTWYWVAGTIDDNAHPLTCGKFRCDTLVNYAYYRGDRVLPTFNTVSTTPLAIWNYFPMIGDAISSQKPTNQSTSTELPATTSTVDTINENNIKDLTQIDFYQMLQNSPNIDKKQINYLWELITTNTVDEQVKIFFYDYISFKNPNYLTSAIINQARLEKGEARHKLLVVLQTIYQDSLSKNMNIGLKEITNYFKELQREKLDKDDGGIVYRGLATLSAIHFDTTYANLTNMDKIHVNILSMKSDPTTEETCVHQIIDNLDNPDDGLVVAASYYYFTQLLINSKLNFFSPESKNLFKEHLAKKELSDKHQTLFYKSAALEFKAALNANNLDEMPALAVEYVSSLDSQSQSFVLQGFSTFTKKKIENL